MNIAVEISPLITASGSFGDKSGVYRYTYGLLQGLIEETRLNNSQVKIILFTFSPKLLTHSLNPEIVQLLNDNVELIGYEKKLIVTKKENDWIDLFNIPYINIVLKSIDKLFQIRKLVAQIGEKKNFNLYIKNLENILVKKGVGIVLHSETGFFPFTKIKNAITVYDLTTAFLPYLHRIETCDLQMRKLRFARKYCEGILVISESTKTDLYYYSDKFKKKKLLVAYPGLDNNFGHLTAYNLDYLNKIIQQFNNRLQFQKYFLYYGTFEPRKNIAYVVRAFADLIEKKLIPSDFKLVLIGGKGWGKIREMVENFIHENYPLQESNPFIIMDYINDAHLYSFIKNAQAVVYPSIYEGFGLPVLESMALGTPVICSDTSSLPEVGGNAALYTSPKDFETLKQQMLYIIENPDKREEISKKGIEQSKNFNWSNSAKSVYRFLQDV